MILRRLMEFSERVPELPPPGYQPGFVTRAVRLRGDGSLIDVLPLTGEKRGKREGLTLMVPREAPQRTVNIAARLICDNVNYALGRVREQDKPAKVAERHQQWRDLVQECAEATGEPAVRAVAAWVEQGGPEALRESAAVADDDEITFEVDGAFPIDSPAVRRFWAGRAESKYSGACIVTGRYGPIVDRMPAPIKGIPEGQMSGTALISVNNPSGCSYGLEAALNSPISVEAAERIGNALNYLLADARHALRVGKVVFVAWTREEQAFDLWSLLSKPEPEQVGRLLASARRGREDAPLQAHDFYVLALSASASRIVVRDYQETTLPTVQHHLARWFDALSLISLSADGQRAHGLFALAASLYRDAKDMPAHVPAALLRSALTGSPLPDYLLGLAIRRNQAMQGPFTLFNKKKLICEPRLALIKALLQQKEETSLSDLCTDHPDPAYHCGRLLAVLEKVQRAALGDINSTVVDKYYGAACASPGAVLGTLVNNAQAHLGKLRKESKDYFHQVLLEEVLSAVGARFPSTLSLQRQGLFALGFYHQKAHDRAQAARARAEKEGAAS